MERQTITSADGTAPARWAGLGWGLALLGVLACQGWLTLGLFGAGDPWRQLGDERPILSGRHPLHLYHGYLGGRSLIERGSTCCYDPAFQAGYPKTPVFDGGSRPAELFLTLAGARYQPAAYKIGLAVCCLLVPLILAAAAWGAGLGGGCAVAAAALSLLVWWSQPCRELLEAGDLDLLLAGLAGVLLVGLLLRFDRSPGPLGWFGLLLVGCLGWFGHPQLFLLLAPLVLLYYLAAGVRHGLGWHVALLIALGGGLAANFFWLQDWVRYWWIWVPGTAETAATGPLTWETVWTASLWGAPLTRGLILGLLTTAVVGLGLLFRARPGLVARLLGLGLAGLLGLAVAGLAVEALQRLGTTRLLLPALWFALLPATVALAGIGRGLRALMHKLIPASLLGGLSGATAALVVHFLPALVAPLFWQPAPLPIGLASEQRALVDLLRAHTAPTARILWEDRSLAASSSGWTALLPLLTERSFLGGLDPQGGNPYAHLGLLDQKLAGRPLANWSDAELAEYCRHYNIGWVACWSPAAQARFQKWASIAEPTAALPAEPGLEGAGPGQLFTLRRPHSFVLKGTAQLVRADADSIVLANVEPDEWGHVVLSLHYQSGWRVSPGRVRVEKELNARDPVSFIRLQLSGPVTRISLRWNPRE
jgi:hypothetical protein